MEVCSSLITILPMSRGGGGLTPVKGRAPLLLLTRLLSPLPPSRAGQANLGVEEKDFLAQHRDCLIDFFFQNEDLRGFHFISKRMFILATGALWQRNRYKQPAGPAPRGTPPALPSWEHVHLISSSAKVEGSAGHPLPSGGLRRHPHRSPAWLLGPL